MSKKIGLTCLLICGCASSTTDWVASSYSTIDQNYSSIGIVSSGHEPYPVVYLGDGIYVKLFTLSVMPLSDMSKSCLYGHNKFSASFWSKSDIEFIPPKSYFIKNDGTISKIARVGRWVSATDTSPAAENYSMRQDAVPITGSNDASPHLYELWKNGDITTLYELTADTNFDMEFETSTGCPNQKFQAKLAFKNIQTKKENVYRLYFSPMPFKYYMLR